MKESTDGLRERKISSWDGTYLVLSTLTLLSTLFDAMSA